jgi:HlyD family secretion protein
MTSLVRLVIISTTISTMFGHDHIWIDTVVRGPMEREVRGLGTVASWITIDLKVTEIQATEVRRGQAVQIFPAWGVLEGTVDQVDHRVGDGATTILVRLRRATTWPSGTRVDGTIQLEKLADVVHVGRPVLAIPGHVGTVFKIDPDGIHATKVRVRFGRTSVNSIEVLEGLRVGDRIIVANMEIDVQSDRITLESLDRDPQQ